MTITAEVRGCTVTLHQPPLASGTQGNVTVAFRFDTAWDGYARTAVFRTHGKTVLVLLENDRCALPPEAAAGGDVLLGAFGVCGDATLTTPFARLTVAAGVPTTLAAQLLAAYRRLTAVTAEAAAGDSAAVRVTEDVDSLHFAFTLPKGDKGDKGEDGYSPEKGVDYWTQEDVEAIDKKVSDEINYVNTSMQYATRTAAAAKAEANAATAAANAAVADLQAKADAGAFKGDKGDAGEDGYTPVRGTDYWTAEDIAAIKGYVDTAILGGAW